MSIFDLYIKNLCLHVALLYCEKFDWCDIWMDMFHLKIKILFWKECYFDLSVAYNNERYENWNLHDGHMKHRTNQVADYCVRSMDALISDDYCFKCSTNGSSKIIQPGKFKVRCPARCFSQDTDMLFVTADVASQSEAWWRYDAMVMVSTLLWSEPAF